MHAAVLLGRRAATQQQFGLAPPPRDHVTGGPLCQLLVRELAGVRETALGHGAGSAFHDLSAAPVCRSDHGFHVLTVGAAFGAHEFRSLHGVVRPQRADPGVPLRVGGIRFRLDPRTRLETGARSLDQLPRFEQKR